MALLDKVIWQIEAHLDEDLTLHILSDRCAASPEHMARVFRQGAGLSIMAYIRARRLSEAAKRIAAQEADILTIALEAGYGSHEAFTRAFANYLGVLPSTVRKARSTDTLSLMEPLEMKKDMIVEIDPPEIRERDGFRVVGMSLRSNVENTAAIPPLWQEFTQKEADVPGAKLGTAYGVCHSADEAGNFTYMAAIEATGDMEGMEVVKIPGGKYAVFTHRGHISDFPKMVYTVWNKGLPDAGLEPTMEPDFELYDDRFDPKTGRGEVELWIPIS